MEETKEIKAQLVDLLMKGNAHATLEQVLQGIPLEDAGKKPHNLPYSIWKLVEHIRITQWDILDFSRNASYKSLKWPDEYWPNSEAPASEKEWDESIARIKSDRDEFVSLISDPNADLYTPFEHGDGQNLLREALLIADHTSHHLGEIIVLRRLLGNWKS